VNFATKICDAIRALDNTAEAYGSKVVHTSEGGALLRRLMAKRASGEEVVFAALGDSWTNTLHRLVGPLTDWLDDEIGVSAPGYCSACNMVSVAQGATRSRTGEWFDVRYTGNPEAGGHGTRGGFGPEGAHAVTFEAGATMSFDTYPVAGQMSKWRIQYLVQPGGGSFSYQIGAGQSFQVDTDGAETYGVTEIIGSGAMVLTCDVTGVAGVTIAGVEILMPQAGKAVVNKIGNGGADARRFVDIPEDFFVAAMQSIAPDVVVICLGVNDKSYNTGLSAFRDNIAEMIRRVRLAAPNCDILLVGPGDSYQLGRAHEIPEYNATLAELAVSDGHTFVDLMDGLGTYTQANANNLYSDPYHVNVPGGFVNLKILSRPIAVAL